MRIQKHGPIRLAAPDEAERVARRLLDDDAFAKRVRASVAQQLLERASAGRAQSNVDGHLGAVERPS